MLFKNKFKDYYFKFIPNFSFPDLLPNLQNVFETSKWKPIWLINYSKTATSVKQLI